MVNRHRHHYAEEEMLVDVHVHHDQEKSILNLAFASGKVPNQATKKHFDDLNKYFTSSQITMIVSVISLFGFLNRWNDTFGTEIEKIPADFVEDELVPLGWMK